MPLILATLFAAVVAGLVTIFAACEVQFLTPPPTPEPPPPSTNPPVVATATFLPLEVLGPGDTTETFEIAVTNGSLAEELIFTIHNLQYEGQASVRLNSGAWLDLTESTVGYDVAPDAQFWGIGGTQSTLHLNVPASHWTPVDGTNVFEFRFNDLNGLLIGFRVLELNMRHDGTNLIGSSQFTYDDPSTWVGPSTNQVDIDAGKYAWYNEPIQEQGTNLLAKCTDCHDRNGRDLAYFNYSNRSIIQRSLFHNVPAPTATNIASYIRSLRTSWPVPYETNGRPWNPPYQPGPTMTNVADRSWAAGAGLTWALTNDLLALDYMFPGGPTSNSIPSYTNTMNARGIPISAQLPDWNHWLPRIHPLDAYPTFYATNRFVGIYAEITNALNSRTGFAAASYFNGRKSIWDAQNDKGGVSKPAPTDSNYFLWFTNFVAIRHWRAVKTWEIMTEKQIENYGTNLFGHLSDNRRWFHGEIFNLAPHKTGIPRYEAWAAQSMQWYQLQLALNSGNRKNGKSPAPVDWNYQNALLKSAWDSPTNVINYATMVLNCIKGIEVSVNEEPMTENTGWMPFRGDPDNMANLTRQNDYELISTNTQKAVIEAVITPWMLQMETYSLPEYAAADKLVNSLDLGGQMRGMIVYFKEILVDTNLTTRMYVFGTNIWPTIDWSSAAP